MWHLIFGLCILAFGLIIGGAGLAFSGIGIGIPMLPLGAYLTYRGWRIYKHEKGSQNGTSDKPPLPNLESTKFGKACVGGLLILVGIGTSAMIVGIPILLAGAWFLYAAFKKEIHQLLKPAQ